MSWTDERVDQLRKLWADGLSASQIAGTLGGVTRNAVIGKVHRLGLASRAKTTNVAVARPRRPRTPSAPSRPNFVTQGNVALLVEARGEIAKPRPVTRLETVPDLAPIVCEPVTIMDLRECMCKWPMGDPTSSSFRFCGGPATPGMPYCTYHAAVAYQPSSDRRRERRAATMTASVIAVAD